ncbi:MAG TPA: phage integrase N-terminal SAM-like domain-containing protein [Verrucomicrobiae bacterium]
MNTTQAINRVRQVLRRQHKALSTEDSYVFWLRRYSAAVSGMSPELSSEKKVESFLTQLTRKYPEYQFACLWAWLFPAHFPCRERTRLRWVSPPTPPTSGP